MLAPKSLRKPLNWQDFETLCKKLWGEVWKCPEIKKNGRTGQQQNGVDVYGVPSGETQYFGIQCKGKDEYSDKQFTKAEVDAELLKAKNFQPALKKLYFATTANKDVAIEEYIRIKNLEHISAGLFEVHLFCWEDIAELIEEHKDTYNFYLKNQNYKENFGVSVTFENGASQMDIRPKFKQERKIYRKSFPDLKKSNSVLAALMDEHSNINRLIQMSARIGGPKAKTNLSFVKFKLEVTNIGSEPLENYKLSFSFDNPIDGISKTNVDDEVSRVLSLVSNAKPKTFVLDDQTGGRLVPDETLVGDDVFRSADLYIKPKPVKGELVLLWKLISKTFKTEGKLVFMVDPEMVISRSYVTVDDEAEERSEDGEISDYIED